MSQGFVVPIPQRFQTATGVPAVGWKIYTYATNSTTPINTWSDGQLSSLNANPVIVDASGYARIFVAQGTTIKLVVHDDTDTPQYTYDYLEPMIPDPAAGSVTAVPTGAFLMWGTSTPPTGFLMCDGSTVLRASYATLDALWSAAGYPYGNGDGSTTLTLPNFRGRFPLGKAAAGTGSTLGSTGGAIDHTHAGGSHTHNSIVPRDGWGSTLNSPSTTGRLNVGDAAGAGQFSSSYQPTADVTVTSSASGTGNTGTANPPYLVVNFIVKT